ncbi:NUDIX domain-containing protein [Streptomyces sp. NRRL B-24572]|uniref:NUDIX hydrolase n=1 Tax=Streptomyces sp. NRRL B-24572 TaxID=1962156 RepID=UPI000A391964|nr:NUDIX domain-containing protein [Streptomyces sp. NRRL B-24572]
MGTPDFIRELRETAGHQLLFLPGVSAVVLDDRGRVLLGKRADNGLWAIIGGIVDPGEQPADAVVREVHEETAVRCVPERIVLVETLRKPVVYPNGDICQYMDVAFRCRAIGGEARVNDDESTEVGWFGVNELPEMKRFSYLRIEKALADEPTWFRTTETS